MFLILYYCVEWMSLTEISEEVKLSHRKSRPYWKRHITIGGSGCREHNILGHVRVAARVSAFASPARSR
jgi:hypothetical protein